MVHTENQLIRASVRKLEKLLRKVQQKEITNKEEILDANHLILSLGIDSDLKKPTPDIHNLDPYPLHESLKNLFESQNQSSQNESDLTKNPNKMVSNSSTPEPIYATINKTFTNSRKQRNLDILHQEVQIESEKEYSRIENKEILKNLTSVTKKEDGIVDVVTPKRCKAKIYESPKVETVQLTKKNIESFKNYMNTNLNSTFKSVLTDDSSNIVHHDPSHTSSKNFCDTAIQDKFIVNLYESRPSIKSCQEKTLKNHLVSYDNKFTSIAKSQQFTSANDNQSANINAVDKSLVSQGMSLACLENYYSVLSSCAAYVDSDVQSDGFQTLEGLTSNGDLPGNANNNVNDLLDSYYFTSTTNQQPQASSLDISQRMAEDTPYYSEVDADIELRNIIKESNQDDFFRLKQEADVQCNIMRQAYQAIETCSKSKQFYNSMEKVIAEKILLLANHKHTNLIQTIRNSQYDNIILNPNNSFVSTISNHRIGKTTIRNIQLPLRHAWLSSSHNSSKYDNWFLLAATEGDRMLCSEPVLLKPGEKHLVFEQTVEFDQLDSDFKVELNVFHMRLRGVEGSRMDLTFNKRVSTLCRSFRKFHYKDLQTQTLVESRMPSSGFTKCGSVMITMHDLQSSRSNWKLTIHNPNRKTNTTTATVGGNFPNRQQCILNNIPDYQIPIEDTFAMDVSVQKTDLQIRRSGFLTVGTETNGTVSWNRRWCVLNGTNLHFYKDPVEADFYGECGLTLLMKNTLTASVELAPRYVCAKPKTLLLDTRRIVDNGRMRHFLTADSKQEMDAWRRDFNTIIVLLRNWNELPYVQNLVTDL